MEFEDWLRTQLPSLLRLATALSGSRHTAEDLVQDVAWKAHRRWDRIHALDHPEVYLRRMLVNEHLSWRRRAARSVRREASHWSGQRDEDVPFDETAAVRLELVAEIGRLSPRQRAVVVLRYLDDLSVADVALTLGCSESSVRAHASRALAHLRVSLPAPAADPAANPATRPNTRPPAVPLESDHHPY